MVPTKKPHIIPKFYLKGFSSNNRSLWIFDKSQNRAFKTALRDAATEEGFYESELLVKASGDQDVTEKILQGFEDPVSAKLRNFVLRLNEGDNSEVTVDEAAALFGAVRGLWLRSREMRAVMLEFGEKSNKALMREAGFTDDLSEMRVVPKSESEAHLKLILDENLGMGYFESLGKQNLVVYRSDVGAPRFYTSDSPVVVTKGAPLAKDNVVFFPVSSRVLLALYEANSYPRYLLHHRKILTASYDLIRHSNRLQVMNSVRQVFCECDDFDLTRSVCGENPQYCDPERERTNLVVRDGVMMFERLPLI